MNYSNYRVNLDIHNTAPQYLLRFNQNDTARKIVFALTENGAPYELTNDCTCILSAVKPDGTQITNNCTVDTEKGTVTYIVTGQTTSAVGVFDCQLTLSDKDGNVLFSPIFTIEVRKVVIAGIDLSSVSEFIALVTAYNAYVADTAKLQELENSLDNFKAVVTAYNDGDLKGDKGEKGDKGDKGEPGQDGAAVVSVSATGTSTDEVKYITVDGVEHKLSGVTVDTALSDTSENPVQNKVVKEAIDKKLAMKTDGASMVRFYAIATNGQQDTYRATDTAQYNTVPLRNEKNNFHVGTPTVDTECATKKYVDDAVAGASSGGGVNTFYTTTKNVPKSFVTANNGVVVVYGNVAYSAGSNPWTATIPLDAFSESSAYNYTFRVLAPTSLADTGADGSSQGATPFIQITMTEGTDSYTLSASAENFSSASVTISSLYGIGTAKSGS